MIGTSVPVDITRAGPGLPGTARVMMMLAVRGAPGEDCQAGQDGRKCCSYSGSIGSAS